MRYILIILLAVFVSSSFASNVSDVQESETNCTKEMKDYEKLKNFPNAYHFNLGICKIKSNKMPVLSNQKIFDEVIALFEKSTVDVVNEKTQILSFKPQAYMNIALLYELRYTAALIFKEKPNDKDLIDAISNYKKASVEGCFMAQNELGRIYFNGANTVENYEMFKELFPEALSSNSLVELPDVEQAIMWFTSAAKHGNGAAQSKLGDLYGEGFGVTRNFIAAYAWYELSIATLSRYNKYLRQDDVAESELKSIKRKRDLLWMELSSQEKIQAHSLIDLYSSQYLKKPSLNELACQAAEQSFYGSSTLKNLANSIQNKPILSMKK